MQDLVHTRQSHYHWATSPAPKWPSCSDVVGSIGSDHHAQLYFSLLEKSVNKYIYMYLLFVQIFFKNGKEESNKTSWILSWYNYKVHPLWEFKTQTLTIHPEWEILFVKDKIANLSKLVFGNHTGAVLILLLSTIYDRILITLS